MGLLNQDLKELLFFSIFPLIVIILMALITRRASDSGKKKMVIPGPKGIPILGHLHLMKNPTHITLHQMSQKYGEIFSLRLGVKPVVVLSSPSTIEECLAKNDVIFADRNHTVAAKLVNYNATTMSLASYGDYWRNMRRVTAVEIFSNKRIEMFATIRQEETRYFLAGLLEEYNKHVVVSSSSSSSSANAFVNFKVTPRPKLADLTYNITMRMIGGTNSVDDIHEKGKQFAEVVKEALRYHGDQNLEDFIPAFRYLDVNGLKKKMVDLMTRIDKLLENLLLKNCNNTNIAATQGGSLKEKKAFIDTLLALQESEPEFFTHQTIKAIILSLIGGGSETTVTTLEWAMSLLLNNPNAMQKAVEEIEKVVGRDRLLEDRDVPKLSYLNNVIIETLRLYPPLPLLLPHKSREDTQIAGYHIPKGTLAMFSLWTIHRDPKLWDEPDKFKPERFDQKEDIGVGNQGYNLLPFGLGRRSCPATNSTKRLLTFVLGAMIQAFEFNLVNGVENVDMTPGNGVIMAKSNPLEVFIRPRQITVQTFGSE